MKKILAIFTILSAGLMANAEETPKFPGGEGALAKFIEENTRYPEVARENGVEGIVVVGFMVNADGSIGNPKVVKFVDPDLEKEALRVVSAMPAWIPADKDGSAVAAPSKVEIPFILE